MKCSYSEVIETGSMHDYAPSSLTGCPLSHLSLHLVPNEEKPVTITRLEMNDKKMLVSN
jgi:hypothetical protein